MKVRGRTKLREQYLAENYEAHTGSKKMLVPKAAIFL